MGHTISQHYLPPVIICLQFHPASWATFPHDVCFLSSTETRLLFLEENTVNRLFTCRKIMTLHILYYTIIAEGWLMWF